MPSNNDDDLLAGITELAPLLLTTMEAFEQVQRNMHPSRLDQLAAFISPFSGNLTRAFETFQNLIFPVHIERFGNHLKETTDFCLRACDGIINSNGDTLTAMKAMRAHARAQEKLYPTANILKPISQYFIEQPRREEPALLEKLNVDRPGEKIGILNVENDRTSRGGFSLYLPEYLENSKPTPLVMALHGGTGHGRDFLWYWLREARSRGFMLLAPTSQHDTWSLMSENLDLPVLLGLVEFIARDFNLDREHILLTGMSDGGTYTLLAGLQHESPFTHLASFSGVLHPDISLNGNIRHAQDRDIYLVHGTYDWMFPIETAHMAKAELEAAGAKLTFREIDGLSHTYARTENPAVLDWFLS